MANFCMKCGAGLPPNTRFCTACGTAVGTPSATPASAAPPSAGFAPVSTQAASTSSATPGAMPASSTSSAPGTPFGTIPDAGPATAGSTFGSGAAAGYSQPSGYTPVGSGGAIPPQYPPPPGMQPGSYVGPPQQSGGALKVILIVVGVLLGLGLLAGALIMFAAWRVTKAVKVNQGGDGVTLSTPDGGTFSAGKSVKIPTEAELGVAIYPGATAGEGGLNFSLGGGSMTTTVLSTSDSPQQVIEFYKGKLGENAAVMETAEGAVITAGKEKSDEGLMITVSRDKSTDRTAITITHTKGKKAS